MPPRDHVWLFWEWEEDSYLADDLQRRAAAASLRVQTFRIDNIPQISISGLISNSPAILWDRAGDIYREARELSDWAEALGSLVINPPRGMLLAQDKGALHNLLVLRNLPVPHTHFLTDTAPTPVLMDCFGKRLVLKPVRSGGGEGVRIQEWCETCLRSEMRSRPGEVWLMQEYIEAALLAGRRAWFRVFYLLGDVRLCWWDNRTHIYEWIPCEQIDPLGLGELCDLGRQIGAAFPMQFFSTEIALRHEARQPVIVDYINDPCDLRAQKRVPNGVPEELLDWVFGRIFEAAKSQNP